MFLNDLRDVRSEACPEPNQEWQTKLPIAIAVVD